MRNTPSIGARGQFKLKEPFILESNRIYYVTAIRSLKDLYDDNIDAFESFYEPLGIDRTKYRADTAMSVNIITLVSDSTDSSPKDVVYVPDTYITSMPISDVPPYHRVVMSIDFGLLPESVDLSDLNDRIKTLGTTVIGKEPITDLHLGSYHGVISSEHHRSMEASRQEQVSNQETDLAKRLRTERENEMLIERIRILEQLVIDNNLIS